jgi:hypothetical protein
MFKSSIMNVKNLYKFGYFSWPFKLVILNFIILLSAFFSASNIPECLGEPEVWFQRSGALITLITVWIEVKLLEMISKKSMLDEINSLKEMLSHRIPNFKVAILTEDGGRDANQDDIMYFRAQTKKRATFFNVLVFINIFVGTLIWAYGDLIYKNIF